MPTDTHLLTVSVRQLQGEIAALTAVVAQLVAVSPINRETALATAIGVKRGHLPLTSTVPEAGYHEAAALARLAPA
jgi:hypothetical protein